MQFFCRKLIGERLSYGIFFQSFILYGFCLGSPQELPSLGFTGEPHRIFFRDTIKKIVFRQPIFLIVSRLVLEGGWLFF